MVARLADAGPCDALGWEMATLNESENSSTRPRTWRLSKFQLITCCNLGAAACFFIAAARDRGGSYLSIAAGSMFLLAGILRIALSRVRVPQ